MSPLPPVSSYVCVCGMLRKGDLPCVFVVYCIVWILCVVNLRMAHRNVRYNLSGTVLVSVVVLFLLRETVHTLIRTLRYRYRIEVCSPAWRPVLLGQSFLDS
jgi:hypothetical protein